jgi:hypothetical protein
MWQILSAQALKHSDFTNVRYSAFNIAVPVDDAFEGKLKERGDSGLFTCCAYRIKTTVRYAHI